jgi:hypothetical protein
MIDVRSVEGEAPELVGDEPPPTPPLQYPAFNKSKMSSVKVT